MSYKYGKQTKVAAEEDEGPKKTNCKGLESFLKEKGVNFNEFAIWPEDKRKQALGKDYEATRIQYFWNYDQPIVTEENE